MEVETQKKKTKTGCFMHCWERVGKLIRRLTRRRKSRNSVSPVCNKTSDNGEQITVVEKAGSPVSIDLETTDQSIDNGVDLGQAEQTSAQRSENGAGEDENTTNEPEEGLDDFAENYVHGELDRISSMFLVNKPGTSKTEETDDDNDANTDDIEAGNETEQN